jgi:hypothetical protein
MHRQLIRQPDEVAARLAHRGAVHDDHALVQQPGEGLVKSTSPMSKSTLVKKRA